ncbi:MAG: hypothetical protein LBU06_02375 [Desulfovibrio sp.]|jgi:hypothetical protein|nr:hypothetical protein [Desulfovibrio sp.]
MYSPPPKAQGLETALVIARSESAVRMDVKILRAVGAKRLAYAHTQAEAFQILDKERTARADLLRKAGELGEAAINAFDLTLCDDTAGDRPVLDFLQELSLDARFNAQPLLVLTGDAQTFATLRAAGMAVLLRPYSADQMREAAQKAANPLRPPLRPETLTTAAAKTRVQKENAAPSKPAAEEKVKSRRPLQSILLTSELFNRGRARLLAGDAGAAEQLFLQVLQRQSEHTGACMGLARVCRIRGDEDGMHKWLVRAAATCLRAGDKERLARIAELLPAGLRKNIFVHEAIGRVRDGAYREAALSFLDAEKIAGDIPLHRLVARACLMGAHPESDIRRLCDALQSLGYKDEAQALRKRLLDYKPFETGQSASWMDSFPLLKDAVHVASYTLWAWKQA